MGCKTVLFAAKSRNEVVDLDSRSVLPCRVPGWGLVVYGWLVGFTQKEGAVVR